MISENRHRRMEAARARAQLTVQDIWLRYVALGGTRDAFDLDGYLQGLVSLETFQQDVLAQALNEALEDDYRTYCVPLSTPPPGDGAGDELSGLVDELVREPPPSATGPESPDLA